MKRAIAIAGMAGAMSLMAPAPAHATIVDYGKNCIAFSLWESGGSIGYVCAWLRIDYTNHVMRGYGSVYPSPDSNRTKRSGTGLYRNGSVYYSQNIVQATGTGQLVSSTPLYTCDGSSMYSIASGGIYNNNGDLYGEAEQSGTAATYC